ncbi:MAG TPA: endolytic transglycosylase MltG, partial [Acidobacteriota bacterium]|nr:endolytic transglycosylase MltG [Acidobacteriota bacterium]
MLLKPIKALLLAAVLLLPALTGWLVRELAAPAAPTAPATGVFFEVEKGWSASRIIARLKSAGIVRSALALQAACRAYYSGERFKAGEYLFTPPIGTREALFRMFGGRIYLEPVTVPEGLTGQEIADLLRPGDPDGAAAFRRAFLDTGPIADLDPRARDLEGYL